VLPAALLALLALAVPASAAGPSVAYVDGAIHVTGTPADDGFLVDANGDPAIVSITSTKGAFANGEDALGVCSTFNEHATCELDYRPAGETTGPAAVVFDLGAGADAVDAGGAAAGVGTVTAAFAGAPSGLTYAGGSPATVTIGGAVTTLRGVARVVGTPFADTFTGGPAAETLLGGDGDDAFDVAAAGGPADGVDCGGGRDTVVLRAGTDAQAGCEVVNGADTTAVIAPPAPPAQGGGQDLPITDPTGGRPGTVIVPLGPRSPATLTGAGTIDVVLRCTGSCAGSVVAVGPPAGPTGPSGLPVGWPALPQAADLLATLQAFLQQSAALQRDLAAAQRAYAEHLRQLVALGLRDDAELARLQAILQMTTAMVQAALQLAAAGVQQAGKVPAGKLQTQIGKNPPGISTPLDGVKPGALDPAKPKRALAAAAAARRRPTGKALTRWLLQQTARALPTIHTTLTPTATAGRYRARFTAPPWLRATGRVLRRRGVTTLPVDLAVGASTARVRVPLPR
jgi:hypothetical protein